MLKEIDTRDFSFYAERTERLEALNVMAEAFSRNLSGDQAVAISRLNALTGTPQAVRAINAAPVSGSLIDQALALVQRTSPMLGFASAEAASRAEFVPDPRIQTTSSGTNIVHLQQVYRGIPVFGMARAVAFSRDQTPQTIVGDNVDFAEEPDLTPTVGVKEAMLRANEYINANQATKFTDGWGGTHTQRRINTSKYTPKVLVTFAQFSQPTVLDKGLFEDYIPAHLMLFHQGPTTRLGWHFIISLPRGRGQYRIIVAAGKQQPGEILYVRRLTLSLKGTGNVHPFNGGDPRQAISFPRPLADYPVPAPAGLPAGFPPDWVDDGTVMNGADTFAGTLGNNVLVGRVVGKQLGIGLGKVINNLVSFDPIATDPEQRVLNAFYFVNFLHDFFYLLGFDESSGNFQESNITGQGYGTDRVQIQIWDDVVPGIANMATPVDSQSPVMNMGPWKKNGRHTALDADIVFHEFAHGVTNRLVGGPLNIWALDAPQSRGMGEGWGDYFALTILNCIRNQNKAVVGDWLTDTSGGIRSHPYDNQYPGDFGQLGKGKYSWIVFDAQGKARTNEHLVGEIWCAALMEMTRRVNAVLGQQAGYHLCWRIVIDGLKLSPTEPSFLDARDGILSALDGVHSSGGLSDVECSQVRRAVWEAFARFGMGPRANSLGPDVPENGVGITADFNLPPGV